MWFQKERGFYGCLQRDESKGNPFMSVVSGASSSSVFAVDARSAQVRFARDRAAKVLGSFVPHLLL